MPLTGHELSRPRVRALIYTPYHTATRLLVLLFYCSFPSFAAAAASCSRNFRSAWYPSTCRVASSSCSLARSCRFSSFSIRDVIVSMSRRRCGRAGPLFLRGCPSDFDLSPGVLGGRGARSIFAFLVGFSDTCASTWSGALGVESLRSCDILVYRGGGGVQRG
jgi:hypothetical protein